MAGGHTHCSNRLMGPISLRMKFIWPKRTEGWKSADMLSQLGFAKRLPARESSLNLSLLYNGFGARGYHFMKTEFRESQITFHVTQPLNRCRGLASGSAKVAPKNHQPRRSRALPISSQASSIRATAGSRQTLWHSKVGCK